MAFRTILAATDLSPRADRAVGRALLIAAGHGAKLVVFHAVDEELADEPLFHLIAAGPEQVAEDNQRAAARQLREQVSARAKDLGLQPEIVIGLGKPALEIARVAHSEAADLVVVGTHGRQLQDVFISTSAERVLRQSECPVLLVRREAREQYRQLLVAVDLSQTSRRALRLAAALAPDASLTVLYVYGVGYLERLQRAGPASGELEAREREHAGRAQAALEEFLAEADLGTRSPRTLVRPGQPAPAIQRCAHELGADLIALGTQGHRPLHGWLLGSVATKILHRANADVLAVRPGPGAP